MRNWLTKKMYEVIAKFGLSVATANVNSACTFMIHQPKLPEELEALKK